MPSESTSDSFGVIQKTTVVNMGKHRGTKKSQDQKVLAVFG
jgi:hypothetical protein